MTNLKTLLVTDTSATGEAPVRVHDIFVHGEIKKIKFFHGKPTELPYEQGIKFMLDGFIVVDPETNESLKSPARTDETVRIRINTDELVARYDELTDGALKMRAAGKVDGEKFITGEFSRDEIITFLKGGNAAEDVESDTGDFESEDGIAGDPEVFIEPAPMTEHASSVEELPAHTHGDFTAATAIDAANEVAKVVADTGLNLSGDTPVVIEESFVPSEQPPVVLGDVEEIVPTTDPDVPFGGG